MEAGLPAWTPEGFNYHDNVNFLNVTTTIPLLSSSPLEASRKVGHTRGFKFLQNKDF